MNGYELARALIAMADRVTDAELEYMRSISALHGSREQTEMAVRKVRRRRKALARLAFHLADLADLAEREVKR